MSQIVVSTSELAPIIHRARQSLAMAETAAEVLDAKEQASLAYDAVKRATRLAKAKGATDEAIASAHRLQAEALELEAAAKRRLADEYDAAQERGEVAGHGRPSKRFSTGTFFQGNEAEIQRKKAEAQLREMTGMPPATLNEMPGLTKKDIHDARQIRDAEAEEPGFVRRVMDEKLEAGKAPTRADINREIEAKKNPHVANNSGNNEWYTPGNIIEMARKVLGGFHIDPASSEIANRTVKAEKFFTAEDDGLAQEWPVGNIWMNPPYAQPLIGRFASRLAAEVKRGSKAIVLVNNATETAWFQEMAEAASAICFPKGRIKFVDTGGNPGAPLQGQAILYFGDEFNEFADAFKSFGFVAFCDDI